MFIIMLTLYCALVSASAFSQGMSELDVKGFNRSNDISELGGTKNPFAPTRSSPQDMILEDLYLSGVALGSGRNFALISGYTVREGDSVAGLRVKAIYKDRVVLQDLDKVHTLYIEGGQ